MKSTFWGLIIIFYCVLINATEFKAIEELYRELPSQLLIEKGYLISINTETFQNEVCPSDVTMTPITVETLTQHWWQQIIGMSRLAFEGRKRQAWLVKADRALMQINKSHTQQEFYWCHLERSVQIDNFNYHQKVSLVLKSKDKLPWITLVETVKK